MKLNEKSLALKISENDSSSEDPSNTVSHPFKEAEDSWNKKYKNCLRKLYKIFKLNENGHGEFSSHVDRNLTDNPFVLFMQALTLGGMIDESIKVDLKKAEKKLRSLIKLDSENSYLYYFLAFIQNKRGDLTKAKRTLDRANSLDQYTSYISRLMRDRILKTSHSPRDRMIAANEFSGLSFPNINLYRA